VVVTKIIKKSILVLAIFSYGVSFAKVKIKSVLSFFNQNSDQGNQVLDESGDESTTVAEPVFFIDWEVDEKTSYTSRIVVDSWTAASDTALDANTGASGSGIEEQKRVAIQIGYNKELENKDKFGLLVGNSSEYDYQSLFAGVNYEKSFAQDNFTLGGSLTYYSDQAKDFDIENDGITPYEDKKTIAFSIDASQLITIRDVMQFSFSYIKQEGMLNSIASTVNIAGTRTGEDLPESRDRYAIGTTWVHGFSDLFASSIAYRYYTDDWGINSSTVTPMVRFNLSDDKAYLEFSYRFYTQTQSDYFQEKFSLRKDFMTSHSKYQDFSANQVGAQYSYNFEGVNRDYELGIGYYNYVRSGGSISNIAQLSFGTSF
jgi:hypothetical protein